MITLADCTNTLLREIGEPQTTQRAVASTYGLAIIAEHAGHEAVDWSAVNNAIIERWGIGGLKRIKNAAWKRLETPK